MDINKIVRDLQVVDWHFERIIESVMKRHEDDVAGEDDAPTVHDIVDKHNKPVLFDLLVARTNVLTELGRLATTVDTSTDESELNFPPAVVSFRDDGDRLHVTWTGRDLCKWAFQPGGLYVQVDLLRTAVTCQSCIERCREWGFLVNDTAHKVVHWAPDGYYNAVCHTRKGIPLQVPEHLLEENYNKVTCTDCESFRKDVLDERKNVDPGSPFAHLSQAAKDELTFTLNASSGQYEILVDGRNLVAVGRNLHLSEASLWTHLNLAESDGKVFALYYSGRNWVPFYKDV